MDAYHGSNATGECPEFFYKNGKKPQTVSYPNPDGTTTTMYINSSNGGKFTKGHIKELENQSKQKSKMDDLREAMLLRLEKRKLQKQ